MTASSVIFVRYWFDFTLVSMYYLVRRQSFTQLQAVAVIQLLVKMECF
jgi:hypothetical protein